MEGVGLNIILLAGIGDTGPSAIWQTADGFSEDMWLMTKG